jgi:plastocyanin
VINRGARVRWISTTSTFHTVTPDGHSAWQRWPTSSAGNVFEHQFTSAGDFPYFCEPHRSTGMVGRVTVH